ncbi:class I SAM-dependent methyltransferase [Kitasatospora sp. NPDC056327]|uniref:class I SAM-dependent methyltransferase n=1 Tax=Kitasatospora sp. NPDC056327 TaxID=3345785 RepID=UPI0035DE678B
MNSTDRAAAQRTADDGTADEARIVGRWTEIYDAVYESAEGGSGADFSGWRSSITGENYTAAETAEWLEGTVAAVLEQRPEAVLELGAGTGLVAEGLLPHVGRYRGTDISGTAVARMVRDYGHHPGAGFTVAQADDPALPGGFDTVVLNSVIHHFPTEAYLRRALANAVRCRAPGGTVFLGDVHSLPLRDALRLSVLAVRVPGEQPAGELRAQLAAMAAYERELVIDPAFFPAFAAEHGLVADLRLKPGRHGTEMNLFRYDVRLRPADASLVPLRDVRQVAWESRTAERLLAGAAGGPPVRVTGIRHPGLAAPVAALAALRAAAPDEPVDLAALLAAEEPAAPGLLPADLSAAADARGLACYCVPAASESADYDAVLAPRTSGGLAVAPETSAGRPLVNVPTM